jgi:pyruvate dehydrogenase E1 component
MSPQIDQVLAQAVNDPDVMETNEWLDALESVIENEGPERAHYLMERMVDLARRRGAHIPFSSNTAYVNTIPADQGEHCPGNLEIEEKLRSMMRWNAMAMVVKANRLDGDLGGHLSSFASLANMLGIGFNHFWHAPTEDHGGDLLYIQGHSAPGIYARAFLEGRLTEEQLQHFRREVDGKGLSSYPHPKLMPDFWQFPTVSMGLGPLMAIYQARFLKYLHARGIADTEKRKVWAFCGDGEMDEPESMGAIGMAGREQLNNLVIVVNCNLQRLDGPVRGNGKIIQELESDFRGAGWNVVKVIWGSGWDELLAKDKEGILQKVMMETVDGEYQNYKARDGAYVRAHFFGKHPKLLEMVSKMSDDDIWRLTRGGHDPHKIYAAYKVAQESTDKPTVILAKSIKGFGFGKSGEARNTAHNTKKLDDEAIKAMRDRFQLPIADADLPAIPFYKPADDTPEMQYLHARRKALGGYLPQRRQKADEALVVPALSAFQAMLEPTAEGREISTTAAYVRVLTTLLRDASLARASCLSWWMNHALSVWKACSVRSVFSARLVSCMSLSIKIRSCTTAKIKLVRFCRRYQRSRWYEFLDRRSDFYSTNNRVMIPFYTYYSMFGLQRIGDLAWAAGDMRARGFLLGGTAGRTTLNGEGLQHEDGHSHVLASTIPNCVPYDPTFAHEVAVIMHDGLRRMVTNQEDVFYYITLMNENYSHPGLKAGQEEGIIKGLYQLQKSAETTKHRVQLLGSGTICAK